MTSDVPNVEHGGFISDIMRLMPSAQIRHWSCDLLSKQIQEGRHSHIHAYTEAAIVQEVQATLARNRQGALRT